jgi:hypothetical protein
MDFNCGFKGVSSKRHSVMGVLASLAAMLQTDSVSLGVLGPLAAVGAVLIARAVLKPLLAFAYFPILLAGALLADDVAAALRLYAWLDSHAGGDEMSNVLLTGTAGLCLVALLLIAVTRLVERDET